MFYLQALGRPVSSFQSLHLIFDCCTISCFSPLMSPGIFVCFKIKWISFLICYLFFRSWTCRFVTKKKRNKEPLIWFNFVHRHNPVQVCDLYRMTRYESFTRTSQPRIIRRVFTSLAVRIPNFIRYCFPYKMNGNISRMVIRWNYRNFVNSVLLFYSQF